MKITLTDKQRAGWRMLNGTQHNRILFDGGARSGKTWLKLLHLITVASRAPGTKLLALRKYKAHARSKLWEEAFKPMLRGVQGWTLNESTLTAHAANGSMITFDGLDDKERAEQVLGGEYAQAFINEAVQVSWQVVTLLMTRLSQNVQYEDGTPVPQKLLLDTNPRHRRHWLYRAGVQHVYPDTQEPLGDADKWGRIVWMPYDNPYLSDEYRATLDALPSVMRKRMRDGEWCDNEGAVYEDFSEETHVISDMPAGWKSWTRYRALDFGYTNPFVCLWGAEDNDGRLYIYKERYVAGQSASVHAQAVSEVSGEFEWTVADHDAGDRAEFKKAGIITRAADKRVSTGLQKVAERLQMHGDGKPRLYVHKSCVNLINEFYSYMWAPAKEGRNDKEEPEKDNDHAMDALRYMIMRLDVRGKLEIY